MARPEVTGQKLDHDQDGIGVSEFCRRWSISPQTFYKLKKLGLMPATFTLGTRVIISRKAIESWLRDCERREREKTSATA
jgi:hypothetical protein